MPKERPGATAKLSGWKNVAARAAITLAAVGLFCVARSRDWRDLVCVSPVNGGGYSEWWGLTGNMVVSGGIRYSGDLAVVAVPRGSQWSLTLSDIPMGDEWRGST